MGSLQTTVELRGVLHVLASEDAFQFCMAFEHVFLAILSWSWNHEHAWQHVPNTNSAIAPGKVRKEELMDF